MQTPPEAPARRDGLANIFRNLAWLVGGRGFSAVCSIAYLAILARSLGLKDFGHFSLIFGTAQALVAIAGFQSWQTMVRFGAGAVLERDWPRFARLTWFCGSVDVAGAIMGCTIAAVLFYGLGDALGVDERYVGMGFAFCCAMVWARMTTPNGIVRVRDRFDIGSYVEAVVPAGRLIGATIILLTEASVGRFLFVWASVELLSAVLYWIAVGRLTPRGQPLVRPAPYREIIAENPGIRGFFGATYVLASLEALSKQGPLLAVGYVLGTSAAGLFRFADQLSQGVGRLSQLVAPAIFPELAKAHSGRQVDEIRRLVSRVSLIAGVSGIVVLILVAALGKPALLLIGGEAYVDAYPILIAGALAASLTLAGSSFEPVLLARGDSVRAMVIRAASLVCLGAALAVLLPIRGALGAAEAMVVAALFYYALSLAAVRREPRGPAN